MKKVLMILMASLAIAALGSNAVAQDTEDDGIPTKLYKMGGEVIDGEIKRPNVVFFNVNERVKFERLLSLRNSFLPKVRASAESEVLR